jgi:cytidine deaminase
MSGNPSDGEGPSNVADLVEIARRARANAYAPYSKYPVGVALRAKDGRVFTGVNVENCAYQSLCAEVNALGTAVAEGARELDALAIVTERSEGGASGAPCGRCRQVLAEFGLDLWVILSGPTGDWEILKLVDLLPRAFTPASL